MAYHQPSNYDDMQIQLEVNDWQHCCHDQLYRFDKQDKKKETDFEAVEIDYEICVCMFEIPKKHPKTSDHWPIFVEQS